MGRPLRPGSAAIQNPHSPNSSSSSNSDSRNGSFLHPAPASGSLEDRLLPQLPPMVWGPEHLAPLEPQALDRMDMPLSIYRRQRVRRAVGFLPQSHKIPAAQFSPSSSSSHGITRGQYRGAFRSIVWNAQALFCDSNAQNAARMEEKMGYLRRLLDQADIVMITEAHGTDGGNRAWRPPIGSRAWWSAGPTTGHAGVGIILRLDFLADFSEEPKWSVIWPGRVAMLSLQGPNGALDIIVSYFHTGGEVTEHDLFGVHPHFRGQCTSFPRIREHMRQRIGVAIKPQDRALTILGGDFNWVARDNDRRSLPALETSGRKDRGEEKHFQRCIGQRHGMAELLQNEMTHKCAKSHSRLDRIYLNQHTIEQVDREIQVVALEWNDLSSHRAILAARKIPDKANDRDRPLPKQIYSHPDYPRRCHLAWQEKIKGCVAENGSCSDIRKLVLLKEAMREAGEGLRQSNPEYDKAIDKEDQLGMVMKFLRAAETGTISAVSICLQRYPRIAEFVDNPYAIDVNLTQSLRRLKDHGVELARAIAIEHMQQSSELEAEQDQWQTSRRKKKGRRLLYRLAPGNASSFGAITDQRGRVITDAQGMVAILRDHWSKTFQANGVDEERLQAWLQEDQEHRQVHGPSHSPLADLRLRKRHIRKAIKLSNNSAPGPDGLPYGAWRAMGEVAVEALMGAFKELTSDEGSTLMRQDYADFNASLLFFLPKKPVRQADDGSAIFDAKGVRPLNVTNSDNRLIASAVRLALEPMIDPLIIGDQRGFLTGRSMIANLLDVDEAMIKQAGVVEDGMAVFYDFAAAFPSIEHRFFHEFFRHLGCPAWLLNIIYVLYLDNFCYIQMQGTRYSGFAINRGIRQGCPLSPLLFAMATDLMLRRLRRCVPEALTRAWADDLAMVLPHGFERLRTLQGFFTDFAAVSGLHLNTEKTVMAPLWEFVEPDVRSRVQTLAPLWGGIEITDHAKYLGLFVGPGKGELSWVGPFKKFQDRAAQWGKLGLGMLLTLQAYQVYVCSVLQFVAQLEDLPAKFEAEERKAVQALFPGPTGWMSPNFLKDAGYWGFPCRMVDVQATAEAAKVRVTCWENQAFGGLQIQARTQNLLAEVGPDVTAGHIRWMRGWAQNSFFHTLDRARANFAALVPNSAIRRQDLAKKNGWQKRICPLFSSCPAGSALLHCRRRMDRWDSLTTLPGHRSDRVCRVLKILGSNSNPRVQAAYIRTVFDGWCTKACFQEEGSCRFRCGRGCDKIRHFATCKVVRRLLDSTGTWTWSSSKSALDSFLCMDVDSDAGLAVQKCLSLYALYQLYNGIRYDVFRPEEFQDAFRRLRQEGLR